jgi:hypothetical protein
MGGISVGIPASKASTAWTFMLLGLYFCSALTAPEAAALKALASSYSPAKGRIATMALPS